ncbi:MAG: ATP-binding cassette domain-containing protein [Bernardetiaceae bacterium]|jgi:ABC-type multidrug transport system ATPase subunit|nr:ATP-binding cassette domain-containing protein [Bernardetiaceae bacterium]
MTITLTGLGQKYGTQWLFSGLDYTFVPGQRYAITGHNGSGKSTLLKILAGMQPPTTGQITYQQAGRALPAEQVFAQVAFAAPYLDLIEEMTLAEAVAFHHRFKPLRLAQADFIEHLGLAPFRQRLLKQFSSGMKQKVKLGLALYSQNPVLLLDEPTANLDRANTDWYLQEIQHAPQPLVVICSNQPEEYQYCSQALDIPQFKKKPVTLM